MHGIQLGLGQYEHWLGGVGVQSWYDLDSTFDLAIVSLTFKIYCGLYLGTGRCRMLLHWKVINWGIRYAMLWCD